MHTTTAGAAPPRPAARHEPFLLTGTRAWRVQAGHVDVFVTAVADGEPRGRRTHLLRAPAGRTLFECGVDTGGHALLAVPGPGALLRELGRGGLDAAGHAPEDAVDGWVTLLCDAAWGREHAPDGVIDAALHQSVDVAAGGAVRPRDGVEWLRASSPATVGDLAGAALAADEWLPLTRAAWLRMEAEGTVRAQGTAAMLRHPADAWAGVDRLHAAVLERARERAAAAEAAERERLRRKSSASRRALGEACAGLAGTLNAEAHPSNATVAAAPDEALLDACRMVGRVLGMEFRRPPGDATAAHLDPLAAIVRASRVSTRRVMLRDGWWKGDAGPLLARVDDGGRPVALIPQGGGYVLRDPSTGARVKVDDEVAATLQPVAHTFYRRFPDTVLKMRHVLRFGLHGCGRDLWAVGIMSTVAALLSLLVPVATGLVFNDVIPGAARPQLVQLTVILVAIAVATAMFNAVAAIALVRLDTRMGSAVQAAVWDRLLALPVPFFRSYTAGELATRAMGIDAIRQVLSGATVTALLGGAFGLFHLGLLFHYSTRLAWWSVLLLAIALGATGLGSWVQINSQRSAALIQSRLAGTVLQLLSAIAKLRVAGAEAHAFSLWAGGFSRQRQLQYRVRAVGNVLAAFNAAFPLAAFVVLYAVAVPLLAPKGTLRPGDFLAFVASFTTCLGGLLAACTALVGTLAVVPLYEQAAPILESAPEVDPAKAHPGTLRGEIELQHVSFRYQADGPAVLRDVSLRIRPGEFVAFVGPSGSGKSTLLRLLLGFESPDAGGVSYDGQELTGLDVQAVRRQIGVVLQSGRLMSGDLFTNIVGSSTATLQDAWEAARMAGLDDDIRAMPMGMHTVVSEGGGTLSGGQRQRLMIARALVHRPRILLFDEATSALDNRTQAVVAQSLDALHATRVVIAHRLSTVVNADRIVVVEGGRLVQQGTYRELMDQDGPFAELARRQLA